MLFVPVSIAVLLASLALIYLPNWRGEPEPPGCCPQCGSLHLQHKYHCLGLGWQVSWCKMCDWNHEWATQRPKAKIWPDQPELPTCTEGSVYPPRGGSAVVQVIPTHSNYIDTPYGPMQHLGNGFYQPLDLPGSRPPCLPPPRLIPGILDGGEMIPD